MTTSTNQNGFSALLVMILILVVSTSIAGVWNVFITNYKLTLRERDQNGAMSALHTVSNLLKQDLLENYENYLNDPEWGSCRTGVGSVKEYLNVLMSPNSSCGDTLFVWSHFREKEGEGRLAIPLSTVASTRFVPVTYVSQFQIEVSLDLINDNPQRNWLVGSLFLASRALLFGGTGQIKTQFVIDLDRTVFSPPLDATCHMCLSVPGSVCCATDSVFDVCDGTHVVKLDANDVNGDGIRNTGSISSLTESDWKASGISLQGTLNNFDFNSPTSGWDGGGTAEDPYRLKFDGIDDEVSLGPLHASTYLAWFYSSDVDAYPSRGVFGRMRDTVFEIKGQLLVGFYNNDWYPVSTGLLKDTWYHVAMVNEGSSTTYYLNGLKIGKHLLPDYTGVTTLTETADKNSWLGKSYDGINSYFHSGAIGLFEACTASVSENSIRKHYDKSKQNYVIKAGGVVIERIVPAVGETAGGTTVSINGWSLQNATSVDFGGSSGSDLVVDAPTIISVTTPPHSVDTVPVEIVASSESKGVGNGFRYVSTPTSKLVQYFDANNVDGIGTSAHKKPTSTLWASLVNAGFARLVGFEGGGWTGINKEKSWLEFDGMNDAVWLPHLDMNGEKAFIVWFRPTVIDDQASQVFAIENMAGPNILVTTATHSGSPFVHACFQSMGKCTGGLNGTGGVVSPITTGNWHQFIITTNGSNATRYFLNGVLIGTEAVSTPLSGVLIPTLGMLRMGAANSRYYSGLVGLFQVYETYINSSLASALFTAGATRFQ